MNCYTNRYAVHMFGAWIGLSRQSNRGSTWRWTSTYTETTSQLAFNPFSTYYGGSQKVKTGNCVLAARTNNYSGVNWSQQGLRAADCAGTYAKAICMKKLC